MSKADDLLKLCIENVGKWTCATCGSDSAQPAAIFREVKNRGYHFEEISPNRWGRTMFCPVCGQDRTHYKLLSTVPEFKEQKRFGISPKERDRIIGILGKRDAFTGASIASTPEIDHKVPWTRIDGDIDTTQLDAEGIKDCFQMLTREHNLLKDRMCGSCKETNIRPPFLEIPFWYKGDCHYCGSCVGCGWYDGKKWREELTKYIENGRR